MKTAKEMFEKLGYKYKNYAGYISYEKELKNGDCYFISFDYTDKTITKHQVSDRYLPIEIKELKAINQQVKELGWDEN